MILDPLEVGDTLRIHLEDSDEGSRLTAEGVVSKNDEGVLVLEDKGIGPLLSCRVLKSEIDGNDVPVEVLMSRDDGKEVLDSYQMGRFKSNINIDERF